MKKKVLLISSITVLMNIYVHAQNTYFTGHGRSLFTYDDMTDEVQADSKQAASSGYTMYDFGVHAENKGLVRASAILRIRNEFGGFYADGASMDIRQVQIEGVIQNRVKFEVGDMYLSQTPYTIWNFDESFIKYESDIFGIRRKIVNYENYFIDNKWRLQGANAYTTLQFMKGIKSLTVQGYGSRILPSNLLEIPDRFLYGTKLSIIQSNAFKLSGNYVGISDLTGTVPAANVDFENNVYTGDFKYSYDKIAGYSFALLGETGFSNTSLREDAFNINKTKHDYFYDAGVQLEASKKHTSIFTFKYRDVGPYFTSPAAQTRRIIENAADYSLEVFPNFSDGTSLRSMTLLDRMSQETGLYNGSISPLLLPYLPQYNSAEPYGQATPNRSGATVALGFADSARIVAVNAEANMLSEIFAEGDTTTSKLRSFTCVQGGLSYQVGKQLGLPKDIELKCGGKFEQTQRDGAVPIDLQSISADAGISVETIKNLHLLLGFKYMQAQGNEALVVRNRFNEATSGVTKLTIDSQEQLLGIGFRYAFANSVFLSTQYILGTYTDNTPNNKNSFDTRQWFVNFNYSF
jgi:hypothetical protein